MKKKITPSAPRSSPFGILEDNSKAFEFEGSPEDLTAAMENAFVIPKRKKLKPKPDVAVLEGQSIKKIIVQRGSKKVKSVKPFDRNRDGATQGELDRAQHLITNITKVDKKQQDAYVKALQNLTQELTNFLLIEVAPYESAIEAALDDAADSLRIITGVQHASFSLGRADSLLRKLPELKTIDWICNKLSIPPDIRALVLNEYFPPMNKKEHGLDMSKIMPALNRRNSGRVTSATVQAKRIKKEAFKKKVTNVQ